MTPFEHLLALVSILVGLAIADLAVSVHRLLRARRRVRWDWLPLLGATMVALVILGFWWSFYRIGRNEVWSHYWSFLVLASYLVCLFLLASAALPDEIPQEGLDLRHYYWDNRRYFWTLFAIALVSATAILVVQSLGRASPARIALSSVSNAIMAAVSLTLARSRSRRFHAVALPVITLLLAVQSWSWQLRG